MPAITKFRVPKSLLSPRLIAKKERLALKALEAEQELEDLASFGDFWDESMGRQAAEGECARLRVPMAHHPGFDPEMPNDVTLLHSAALGKLYAHFVAYTTFLEAEVALLEVDADGAEALFEHVSAEIRLRKSGTVKDKDTKTLCDPKFIAAEVRLLQARAKAKLLKARVKGYERCSLALSREMSRRGLSPEAQ